jgi:hypothetical protein
MCDDGRGIVRRLDVDIDELDVGKWDVVTMMTRTYKCCRKKLR